MEKLEQFICSKKLKIYQDDKYFKYNLDSILLADFVYKHYKKGKIIDLATGTLPIPLFLSSRLNEEIFAVELQKEVYELASKTIDYNNIKSKVNLLNEDVNNLKNIFSLNSFDVIICNPPYFNENQHSKKSIIDQKVKARHDESLTIDNIIEISKYLLNNKGSLFLIYRTENLVSLLDALSKNNLEPKIIRYIYADKNKKAKLFLIEARLNANSGCIIEKPLIVYKDSQNYTKEIMDIFGGD